MISLTSTSFGCSIANAIALAIASAGIVILRKSCIPRCASLSEILLANSDSVVPGEMTLRVRQFPTAGNPPSGLVSLLPG